MDSMAYADIVILALIAGFILLRLRGVLGQKTGHDNPQFFARPKEKEDGGESEDEKIVHISDKLGKTKQPPADETDVYLYSLKDEAVASAIADIKKRDPQFSATAFLEGAKMAYEMVFDAFAKGDKATLEMLLDKPLYQNFLSEIKARDESDSKTENTLVSVRAKDLVEARLIGNKARLTVTFDSEQVTLVKDKNGAIIEGDPSYTSPMDDEWVFERDLTSKNPNWVIIET